MASRPRAAGEAVGAADAGTVPERVPGLAAPPVLRWLLAPLAAQLCQPAPAGSSRPAAAAARAAALQCAGYPPGHAPVASPPGALPTPYPGHLVTTVFKIIGSITFVMGSTVDPLAV